MATAYAAKDLSQHEPCGMSHKPLLHTSDLPAEDQRAVIRRVTRRLIAFAVGNLGRFVGPSVMGWLRDATGAYSSGLLVLAAALIVEAALVMTLKVPSGHHPISQ